MTKPLVMPPNVEALVVDYLEANIDEPVDTVTVGVGVPPDYRPGSSPNHIEVQSFTVNMDHPVMYRPRVRLVARALDTTEAIRLAAKALGILAAHPGTGTTGISGCIPFFGPDTARDDESHTELASVELEVSVRSLPIT